MDFWLGFVPVFVTAVFLIRSIFGEEKSSRAMRIGLAILATISLVASGWSMLRTNYEKEREARIAERAHLVAKLTNKYMLSHDGITSDMGSGLQLPPIDWLNDELAKQRKPWRIKRIDGSTFETYDIG